MLKSIKTNTAFLAGVIITLTMGLNACGEKTMTIPRSLIHSFDHKVPRKINRAGTFEKYDLSSDELKPFMDGGVFFWGVAIRNTDNTSDYEFDIGVQFYAETEDQRIFVEKVNLNTPHLQTERVINEFVEIDKLSKEPNLYWKRYQPFEKIPGDSIPLTADFFMMTIDYKLDDKPTKQMSIRFDNTSFSAPNF